VKVITADKLSEMFLGHSDPSVLGNYAMSTDNELLMFRRSTGPSSSRSSIPSILCYPRTSSRL